MDEFNMPKTTVAAIIIDRDQHILLTKRNIQPYKGEWCLPGGHIDQFETAEDAIVREVKEEVGVDFECSFYKYFDEIIPENDIHAVVLVFIGKHFGNVKIDNNEVAEVKWFSLDQALSINLAFKNRSILVDLKKQK